jgi:hypothetical protein
MYFFATKKLTRCRIKIKLLESVKQLLTDPHMHGLLSAFDTKQFTKAPPPPPRTYPRNKRIWVEKRLAELQ